MTTIARACLCESKFPQTFWSYGNIHATDSDKYVLHSWKRVFLESIFGHAPPYLSQKSQFGCFKMYSSSASKLSVFESCINNGLLLRNDSGRVYLILTNSGTVLTKHGRFRETKPLVCPVSVLAYALRLSRIMESKWTLHTMSTKEFRKRSKTHRWLIKVRPTRSKTTH